MNQLMVKNNLPSRERGAVLLVAMILLLVMTLMGVNSMQNARLQERMSGAYQDREVAFQMAELALKEGEWRLQNLTVAPDMVNNADPGTPSEVWGKGKLKDSVATGDAWWSGADSGWWTTEGVQSVANTTADNYTFRTPYYVIEFAGVSKAGESMSVDTSYINPNGAMRIYRITALGTGGRETTEVILESTFGIKYPE